MEIIETPVIENCVETERCNRKLQSTESVTMAFLSLGSGCKSNVQEGYNLSGSKVVSVIYRVMNLDFLQYCRNRRKKHIIQTGSSDIDTFVVCMR